MPNDWECNTMTMCKPISVSTVTVISHHSCGDWHWKRYSELDGQILITITNTTISTITIKLTIELPMMFYCHWNLLFISVPVFILIELCIVIFSPACHANHPISLYLA